jgi:hypothetical protein
MSKPATALVVLRPGAQAGEGVRRTFEAAGFTVGPLVGRSFSIEGPRELMEAHFPDFADGEGTGAELRHDWLDDEHSRDVQAVVSEPPPDFGPTSY